MLKTTLGGSAALIPFSAALIPSRTPLRFIHIVYKELEKWKGSSNECSQRLLKGSRTKQRTVSRAVLVPSPSWPCSLLPTVHTAPDASTNALCRKPAHESTTPEVKVSTHIALEELAVELVPSWLSVPLPHE
jgi:hypothetical protein